MQEAVQISLTSDEFRRGFRFALACIHDYAKHHEHKETLELLESTLRLINMGAFFQ
jgi:hypothetical protein